MLLLAPSQQMNELSFTEVKQLTQVYTAAK